MREGECSVMMEVKWREKEISLCESKETIEEVFTFINKLIGCAIWKNETIGCILYAHFFYEWMNIFKREKG